MRCVVANWKMNLLAMDMEAFCETFLAGYEGQDDVQVAIAPPLPYLHLVWTSVRSKGVRVFAQNGHQEGNGAYTGEVSMAQLKDSGCSGVILGHSERRQYFYESEELLVKKIRAAREAGLLPLLCVGETLAQREAEQTLAVLRHQLSVLAEVGPGPLWLAYEPVWAIGTGLRADAHQIREAHHFMRVEAQSAFGGTEGMVPILYGGSVTPESFPDLLEIPQVAGGLVGGASLDPEKFGRLVRMAQAKTHH